MSSKTIQNRFGWFFIYQNIGLNAVFDQIHAIIDSFCVSCQLTRLFYLFTLLRFYVKQYPAFTQYRHHRPR